MRDLIRRDDRASYAWWDAAEPGSAPWRLALGLVLCLAVMWLGAGAIWAVLGSVLPEELIQRLERDQLDLLSAESLLVLLYSFVLFWIGPALAVAAVHKISPLWLLGPPRAAVRQFAGSTFALVALVLLMLVLPPYGFDPPLVRALDPGTWLMLLLPALLGILVQAGGEEVLFRGYLQGMLAARFKMPCVWMGVPSVLFGLAHYAPESYGANTWLVVGWATLFGFLAADLTARAGTLGPAMVFHVVANAAALLLVAPQGEMSGLALYHYPFSAGDAAAIRALLPADVLSMILCWLTVRLVLRR